VCNPFKVTGGATQWCTTYISNSRVGVSVVKTASSHDQQPTRPGSLTWPGITVFTLMVIAGCRLAWTGVDRWGRTEATLWCLDWVQTEMELTYRSRGVGSEKNRRMQLSYFAFACNLWHCPGIQTMKFQEGLRWTNTYWFGRWYCTIKINSSVTRHGGAWRDEFWNLITHHGGSSRIYFLSRSVQNLGSGLLWASFLSCGHSPYNFLAILKVSCFKLHNYRASDQIQPKFNGEKWIFFLFNRFAEINFSDDS
jgi:hypothetical protein